MNLKSFFSIILLLTALIFSAKAQNAKSASNTKSLSDEKKKELKAFVKYLDSLHEEGKSETEIREAIKKFQVAKNKKSDHGSSAFAFTSTNKNFKTQVNNGTQLLKTYFFSVNSPNKRVQNTLMPNAKLLYYKDYIIEEDFIIHQSSYGGETSVDYRDPSYYFINLKSEKCATYNKFEASASKIDSFNWKDKKRGMGYLKNNDLKLETKQFRDTLINGKSYKYFIDHFKEDKSQKSILYFVKDQLHPGFSLNKSIDEKKYGTLVRADAIDVKKGTGISSEMEIIQSNLTKEQIAVFEAWIQQNKVN